MWLAVGCGKGKNEGAGGGRRLSLSAPPSLAKNNRILVDLSGGGGGEEMHLPPFPKDMADRSSLDPSSFWGGSNSRLIARKMAALTPPPPPMPVSLLCVWWASYSGNTGEGMDKTRGYIGGTLPSPTFSFTVQLLLLILSK